MDDPVVAENDQLNFFGPGQRGQYDLALAGGIRGRLGPARAALQGGLASLAADVVNDQVVAGLLQVGNHVAAHHSEPDEAYPHGELPPLRVVKG